MKYMNTSAGPSFLTGSNI